MRDFIGACLLGLIIGAMFGYGSAKAQSYPMTNAQGYNVGTVQINGNTAQFVNPMGYTTQTATIYPNQVVFSNGNVIGTPQYTVPQSPPTVPTIRVLQ